MDKSEPVVYVVDDSEDNLTVYTWMLTSAGYQVQSFLSGIAFLDEADLANSGCILLDNQMPVMSGLEVQQKLGARENTLPIVFMSGHSTYGDVMEAARAGAYAFLEKPFHKAELLAVVADAVGASTRSVVTVDKPQADPSALGKLTAREQQVCRLITAGHTNRQIAEELDISISTVEFHRANLMDKLGVRNLAELIKLTLRLET